MTKRAFLHDNGDLSDRFQVSFVTFDNDGVEVVFVGGQLFDHLLFKIRLSDIFIVVGIAGRVHQPSFVPSLFVHRVPQSHRRSNGRRARLVFHVRLSDQHDGGFVKIVQHTNHFSCTLDRLVGFNFRFFLRDRWRLGHTRSNEESENDKQSNGGFCSKWGFHSVPPHLEGLKLDASIQF